MATAPKAARIQTACQATGAIGDPATGYVCIPANTFSASGQCPSGTAEIDNGDGTFDCIPPSGEACAVHSQTWTTVAMTISVQR